MKRCGVKWEDHGAEDVMRVCYDHVLQHLPCRGYIPRV